jgi:hypothetical protein
LVRNNDHHVFIIDHGRKTADSLMFLRDSIYDISDNGNYILYVKENIKISTDEKKINAGLGLQTNVDTSAILYMYNLKDRHIAVIDSLAADPQQLKDQTTIYGRYFFRFNPACDMVAYMKRVGKKSSALVIKRISDLKAVYRSSVPQDFMDEGRSKDFTSSYIHVKNIDSLGGGKQGLRLLNGKPRNSQYFFNLYHKMNDEEWDREMKKAKGKF